MGNPLLVFVYKYQRTKGNQLERAFPKKMQFYKNSVSPQMIRFKVTGYNNEQLLTEWIDKVLVPFR